MANSAANMLPPEYDDVHPNSYDPAYTADISTKMRIPHTIDMVGHDENNAFNQEEERHRNTERAAAMQIPDKLVLDEGDRDGPNMDNRGGMLGDLRHMPAFHLDLDPHSMGPKDYINLQTPPRVLTLNENLFSEAHEAEHTQSENAKNKKPLHVSFPNGYIPATPPRVIREDLEHEAALSTPGQGPLIEDDDDDEMAVLRRQISKISRHVIRLEEENAKRSQRELFFYPMVMGYLLFQMARWFLRRD